VATISENGEKHFADVKTESGLVIEFQNSHMHRDERQARENFYRNLVWVVNGPRRKRDKAQFFASIDAAIVVKDEPRLVSVRWKEGALLRDWGASRVPVYFDFDMPTLWRLNPGGPNGTAYLSAVPKTFFLQAHRNGSPFEEMCTKAVERVAARRLIQQAPLPRLLIGFERYWARRQRRRRRF